MGTTEIVAEWTDYLKSEVLTHLGRSLVAALALFSLAVPAARSCQSGRVAAAMHHPVRCASRRRRWERWLSNPKFQALWVQDALAEAVWQRWSGTEALVLLDETPQGKHLRCLKVSLAFRHRAVPLAWVCYRPDRPPGGMPRLVKRLLIQALAAAPPDLRLIVTADRGLAWPAVVDLCTARGWGYLLRLQGQTRVRLPDGQNVAARDLAPRPGASWTGAAEVFKKAGWRAANVVALWERGVKEPWLLVTDQPAQRRQWRRYAKRMWIEEAFRDDKSQGFNGQLSRVTDPEHANRLHTILALAALLVLSLGTWLLKHGWRHNYDPRRVRRLSVFQLGLYGLCDLLKGRGPKHPLLLYFSSA